MKKTALKRSIDLLMTAALLLLMPYFLIGEAAHEWIGMGMAVLFVLHLALNWQWVRGLGKGRWPAYRILQTVLAALCFLTMAGLMVSGITSFPAMCSPRCTSAAGAPWQGRSIWFAPSGALYA